MSRGPLRLLRDFAALSGGEVVAKVAGFAAFAYLARALGPLAYGWVELTVAVVTSASLVVDMGLGPIAARRISRRQESAGSLAALVPAARLLLAGAAFGLVVAAAAVLGLAPDAHRLMLVFGISIFALPWTLNWLFQGLDQMAWVGLAQPIRMLCFVAGVLILVSSSEDLWRVGVVEIAAASAMSLYYLLVQGRLSIPIRLSFSLGRFSRLFREAAPVGVSQMLWALNHYAPMFLMGALVGGAQVAWLGGSLRIVISVNTFVWLYFFTLYPVLVRTRQEPPGRLRALAAVSLRATAWAGVLFALLGSALAEPICRLAFGAPFSSAAGPFALLVWVIPISLLSGHARFALIAYGHQVSELAAAAAGTAVTLGLGLALIPPLGALGAALTMIGAALVVWGVAQVAMRRLVAPIPFLGPTLLPSLAALLALGATHLLAPTGPWLEAASLAAVYLLIALLLDRSLVADTRTLLRLGATDAPE